MIDAEMRINGIYRQRQSPFHMMRIKLAGGLFSARQAYAIADLADQYARGALHLTSRCSIELHWLEENALSTVIAGLTAAGLTSRGACGGAVRGVSVLSCGEQSLNYSYVLAEYLQKYFTGDTAYEGLPKKFKIGIESGYGSSAHRIQDVGIVLIAGRPSPTFDVWVAGGLGREPQQGFLLAPETPEEMLLPLIEALLALYREMAPHGKRLKHVVREVGQEAFAGTALTRAKSMAAIPLAHHAPPEWPGDAPRKVEVPIFAGELTTSTLRRFAEIAVTSGTGMLYATSDQNLAIEVRNESDAKSIQAVLEAELGAEKSAVAAFRVCPGNHECRLGLSATRDVAGEIINAMPDTASRLTWAISGCANSCSQPQIADVGIVTVRLAKQDGENVPLFDMYRRTSRDGFGVAVAQGVTIEALLELIKRIEQ